MDVDPIIFRCPDTEDASLAQPRQEPARAEYYPQYKQAGARWPLSAKQEFSGEYAHVTARDRRPRHSRRFQGRVAGTSRHAESAWLGKSPR